MYRQNIRAALLCALIQVNTVVEHYRPCMCKYKPLDQCWFNNLL